jgi:8-oxo-dGTP pyrophosphatase MutT (NUDIX family)
VSKLEAIHAGGSTSLTRDFAATTFVVWHSRILLHKHEKLGMWLPPGGHVEPHELPCDAAVREVLEESGVQVRLEDDRGVLLPEGTTHPRLLVRPRGVQLERIRDDHEHIDLIYFGKPQEPYEGRLNPGFGWYGPDTFDSLELIPDVRAWCRLALFEMR